MNKSKKGPSFAVKNFVTFVQVQIFEFNKNEKQIWQPGFCKKRMALDPCQIFTKIH